MMEENNKKNSVGPLLVTSTSGRRCLSDAVSVVNSEKRRRDSLSPSSDSSLSSTSTSSSSSAVSSRGPGNPTTDKKGMTRFPPHTCPQTPEEEQDAVDPSFLSRGEKKWGTYVDTWRESWQFDWGSGAGDFAHCLEVDGKDEHGAPRYRVRRDMRNFALACSAKSNAYLGDGAQPATNDFGNYKTVSKIVCGLCTNSRGMPKCFWSDHLTDEEHVKKVGQRNLQVEMSRKLLRSLSSPPSGQPVSSSSSSSSASTAAATSKFTSVNLARPFPYAPHLVVVRAFDRVFRVLVPKLRCMLCGPPSDQVVHMKDLRHFAQSPPQSSTSTAHGGIAGEETEDIDSAVCFAARDAPENFGFYHGRLPGCGTKRPQKEDERVRRLHFHRMTEFLGEEYSSEAGLRKEVETRGGGGRGRSAETEDSADADLHHDVGVDADVAKESRQQTEEKPPSPRLLVGGPDIARKIDVLTARCVAYDENRTRTTAMKMGMNEKKQFKYGLPCDAAYFSEPSPYTLAKWKRNRARLDIERSRYVRRDPLFYPSSELLEAAKRLRELPAWAKQVARERAKANAAAAAEEIQRLERKRDQIASAYLQSTQKLKDIKIFRAEELRQRNKWRAACEKVGTFVRRQQKNGNALRVWIEYCRAVEEALVEMNTRAEDEHEVSPRSPKVDKKALVVAERIRRALKLDMCGLGRLLIRALNAIKKAKRDALRAARTDYKHHIEATLWNQMREAAEGVAQWCASEEVRVRSALREGETLEDALVITSELGGGEPAEMNTEVRLALKQQNAGSTPTHEEHDRESSSASFDSSCCPNSGTESCSSAICSDDTRGRARSYSHDLSASSFGGTSEESDF